MFYMLSVAILAQVTFAKVGLGVGGWVTQNFG